MDDTQLEKQNEVIIGLLARQVFGVEHILKVVQGAKMKENPLAYIRAYNALDGKTGGSAVAAIAGVSKQAMSKILQLWEEKGIVYRVGTNCVRLLKLPETDPNLPKNGRVKSRSSSKN